MFRRPLTAVQRANGADTACPQSARVTHSVSRIAHARELKSPATSRFAARTGGAMELCFATGAPLALGARASALRPACARRPRRARVAHVRVRMCAEPQQQPSPSPPPAPPSEPPPFGLRVRTNGDVLKFGIAAIAFGYAMKLGIQATGVPDLKAGQLTTGILSVASLIGWVSTYVFRVGTKSMTYAQQLKDYEDAVIEKRYSELTEEELIALREELEDDL